MVHDILIAVVSIVIVAILTFPPQNTLFAPSRFTDTSEQINRFASSPEGAIMRDCLPIMRWAGLC